MTNMVFLAVLIAVSFLYACGGGVPAMPDTGEVVCVRDCDDAGAEGGDK